MAISWRFPRPSSLGVINLLEPFFARELRHTVYLLDHQFIVEKSSQTEVMHRTKYVGMRTGLPCALRACPPPLASPPVHHPGSSPNRVLSGLCGGFSTQAWLVRSLAIGDWTQLPAPFSREVASGAETSEPLIVLVFLQTVSILWDFPKVTSVI